MKKKTGSRPTKPCKPYLILRNSEGIIDRYPTFQALYEDLWKYGVSAQRLYSNTLSHGDFRRSDEHTELGFNPVVALSVRWSTGEPALSPQDGCGLYLMDRRIRRGGKKSWISKKRHRKHDYRSINRVTKVYRYGHARVAEEGEPPVRDWKNGFIPPYEDWHDRWTTKSWKDQSKCRKQWERKLK